MSHPTRVRGLKRIAEAMAGELGVAPHTGAWIETPQKALPILPKWSHPTRVRGLKRASNTCQRPFSVAPHTGAWIETSLFKIKLPIS